MIKKTLFILFGSLSLACWAAQAVHEAEYLDSEGNLVVVVTFDDGSVRVTVADKVLTGSEAMTVMQRGGIDLTVNPSGHIMGQNLTDGAVLKIKPHLVNNALTRYDYQQGASKKDSKEDEKKVSETETSSGTAQSGSFVVSDTIPSNVAAGTAIETQRYYESATHRGSSDVARDPVSGQ